jgi:hypothetical protein
MVVVQTKPSTSDHRRKTRRSYRKKNAQRLAKATSKNDGDDVLMIDTNTAAVPQPTAAPEFPPLPASAQRSLLKSETRNIPIPPHRMAPLRKDWINIFGPLTEILGLQVRMNLRRKCVEIRVSAAGIW